MAKREDSTRNSNGDGSIQERETKKGTSYDVYYSYHDPAGKSKRGTKTFHTKREAQQFARQNGNNHDKGGTVANTKHTVESYLQVWLDEIAPINIRPSTMRSYRSKVKLYIIPNIGGHKLTALTASHVDHMTTTLQQQGLSPRSVQYARSVLRIALNDAKRKGFLIQNVVQDSEAIEQVGHTPAFLDVASTQKFIQSLQGDRQEALFSLLILTGMRVGEALALRWQDIDYAKNIIHVRHTLENLPGQAPRLAPTKTTKSTRTIQLVETLAVLLQQHQQRQEGEKETAGARWEGTYPDLDNMIFTNKYGDPYSYNTLYSQFTRAVKSAGLPKMRIHDLRHTFASLAVASNMTSLMLSKTLGHINTNLTNNTYSHLYNESQKEAMNAVESLLSTGK